MRTETNPRSGRNLVGKVFKTERYDCTWTVLYYHRNDSWVCEEPDHHTTCEFYESEILEDWNEE